MPPTAVGDDRMHIHGVRRGRLIHRPAASETTPTSIPAGAAFLTRGHARRRVIVVETAEVIVLSVPTDLFDTRPSFAADEAVVLPADAPLVAPVFAFAEAAAGIEATDLSGVEHYFLERLLQEMALAISLDQHQTREVPRERPLFERALTILATQCADASLTATSVARDLNVSLRQLERVLEEHGTTLRRELRRARVDHAVALLRDPAYAALTIDRVAEYSGFSNGSSLARAMAAENRPSPARIRSQGAPDAAGR